MNKAPEGSARENTPDALARVERRNAWIKEMAPDQFARMQFPDRRQYSFRAFEALEFAYDQGLDFAFKTALYDLMWAEGGDVGDIETLMQAGERVGIDPAAFLAGIEQQPVKDKLRETTQELIDRGGYGSPTIFVGGDDMYFGNDRMPLIKDAVLRRRAG